MAEKPEVRGWLSPDECYIVLAIEHLPGKLIAYRIATKQGTPALFEASLFVITDPRVSAVWVVQYSDSGDINLVPEPWCTPGFWEDFFDGHPDAIERYHEVLRREPSV